MAEEPELKPKEEPEPKKEESKKEDPAPRSKNIECGACESVLFPDGAVKRTSDYLKGLREDSEALEQVRKRAKAEPEPKKNDAPPAPKRGGIEIRMRRKA